MKQLEYFVKVAEVGSFTRASIAMGVAQPEVSRKINQLEVELHQRLFNRNGRGISLTDEGAIMLEHASAYSNTSSVCAMTSRPPARLPWERWSSA